MFSLTSGGCPKSILLSNDGTQQSSEHQLEFGIYNFMRYDGNLEIIYEHTNNPKYKLKRIAYPLGTTDDSHPNSTIPPKPKEIRGWFVSSLISSLKLICFSTNCIS